MKLKDVFIFAVEYEVPPSMDSWKVIIAAASAGEAQAYIERYWGKKVHVVSMGMDKRLDAIADSALRQAMKLGAVTANPAKSSKPGKKEPVKEDLTLANREILLTKK